MKRDFQKVNHYGLYPARRNDVDEPLVEAQVELCSEWVYRFCRQTTAIRDDHTSYGLKHLVERWYVALGEQRHLIDRWGKPIIGGHQYVSNGAFIEAARREGYAIRRSAPDSLNAHFNLMVRRDARDPECMYPWPPLNAPSSEN